MNNTCNKTKTKTTKNTETMNNNAKSLPPHDRHGRCQCYLMIMNFVVINGVVVRLLSLEPHGTTEARPG